jgi:predicted nucleic acid-binding protein
MGWLDELRGKAVYLDTAPIIYFIEDGYPEYKKMMEPFFKMVSRGECLAITSAISVLEGLVLPIRNQDAWLIRKFRNFFYHTRVKTVDISSRVAEEAAELRALHNKIQLADAIQIATALDIKAACFLTNDKELTVVPGIKVLILDDCKIQPKSDISKTDS